MADCSIHLVHPQTSVLAWRSRSVAWTCTQTIITWWVPMTALLSYLMTCSYGQTKIQEVYSGLWPENWPIAFIEEKYPWFLPVFDAYPYNIQRADVIRYFALAYYGGTYLDLDLVYSALVLDWNFKRCHRRLDGLRTYSAWLRGTTPIGISNDSMGTAPNHPFYLRVIKRLERYARNWRLPYLTVMLSTGPLFLSIMWKEYLMSSPPDEHRIAILPEGWYAWFTNTLSDLGLTLRRISYFHRSEGVHGIEQMQSWFSGYAPQLMWPLTR
jgi:hypothetical protein